jgi:hypothetical protein
LAQGPESIIPIVVMDSGLAAARRPGMTNRGANRPHAGEGEAPLTLC